MDFGIGVHRGPRHRASVRDGTFEKSGVSPGRTAGSGT